MLVTSACHQIMKSSVVGIFSLTILTIFVGHNAINLVLFVSMIFNVNIYLVRMTQAFFALFYVCKVRPRVPALMLFASRNNINLHALCADTWCE